jgi:Spy/CpxP family protein refolding chaperone
MAAAQARRADAEGRGMRRAAVVAEYLGLTDQQKASWRALEQQQREQMKPLRDEGRDLRLKLRQALGTEAPDATAVGEATLALKAHREKARAQREAFEQQRRALLSPEQQQKLDAMKAARRTLGRGRGDRLGRPGMRERRRDGVPLSETPPVLG